MEIEQCQEVQAIFDRGLPWSCKIGASWMRCQFLCAQSLSVIHNGLAITAVCILFWMMSLTTFPAFAQEVTQLRLGLHIGYVPGDSFFPIDIKESVAETLSESALSGATELRYRYAPLRPCDMTLPLYLGFETIGKRVHRQMKCAA